MHTFQIIFSIITPIIAWAIYIGKYNKFLTAKQDWNIYSKFHRRNIIIKQLTVLDANDFKTDYVAVGYYIEQRHSTFSNPFVGEWTTFGKNKIYLSVQIAEEAIGHHRPHSTFKTVEFRVRSLYAKIIE